MLLLTVVPTFSGVSGASKVAGRRRGDPITDEHKLAAVQTLFAKTGTDGRKVQPNRILVVRYPEAKDSGYFTISLAPLPSQPDLKSTLPKGMQKVPELEVMYSNLIIDFGPRRHDMTYADFFRDPHKLGFKELDEKDWIELVDVAAFGQVPLGPLETFLPLLEKNRAHFEPLKVAFHQEDPSSGLVFLRIKLPGIELPGGGLRLGGPTLFFGESGEAMLNKASSFKLPRRELTEAEWIALKPKLR